MKVILLIFITISISAFSQSTSTVFPGVKWMEAPPEEVGINTALLKQAVNFLEQNSGSDGAQELMIIRQGKLIYKGDSIYKVHGVWSCTKSFTSTVLGLLIDDQKAELHTLSRTIIPEMARSYPDVRLSHFATMTSGYKSVGDTATTGYTHGASKTPFFPDSDPLFAPGSKYAYWDAAMNQFAHILTIIAEEPLDAFFKRRIGDPIGMNTDAWHWGDFGPIGGVKVVGGAGNNGKGIYISAIEMARFGLLFLNEGNWNGSQLISKNWIKQSTQVQVPASMKLGTPLSDIDGIGVYGFNWWVNGIRTNGSRFWPDAPAGTYAASGYNNNKMFIIPAWDMVVVRLGLDENELKITDNTWNDFIGKVGNAIED